MILPLQFTFRNMKGSKTAEGWIRKEIAKLETFYPRIICCRVMVEIPHRHHRRGSPYHLRIDLTVPGGELVIKQQPSLHSSIQQIHEEESRKHLEPLAPYKSLRQAIEDAFKAAGRRLQDYARRQRGAVKFHESAPQGRLSKLFQEEGYGFIETPSGDEIYFHRNGVLDNAFHHLKVGTAVKFTKEQGDKGPQATTVRIVHKRRAHRSEVQVPTASAVAVTT